MLYKKIMNREQTRETLDDLLALAIRHRDSGEIDIMLEITKFIKKTAIKWKVEWALGLIEECYKMEAEYSFDSYMVYLEWDREPERRFYLPRRRVLMSTASSMQDLIDDKLDLLTISMPPGSGKLLADDTPILTKDGWKNHGELVEGDMVIGLDGVFVKVQHVFPKDYADCKITFSNGEEIYCHENHEWAVLDKASGKDRIIETKQLFKGKIAYGEIGKRGSRYRYFLPNKDIVKGIHRQLPVDAYTLGVWIGDGTNTKPDLTICNTDLNILDSIPYKETTRFQQQGCVRVSFEGLRSDLRKLGMCHSRETRQKHIPDIYMVASIEQRLELLAGLLDTDGTLCKKKKRYIYSTTDEKIKDDVVSLVSTFGWRCCVTREEPKMSTSGIQGRKAVYQIGFNPTIEIPCRVERKQLKEFNKQRRISITNIERIPKKIGNCIQVEGGIYLAGKTMLPTHNSTLGIFFLSWVMGKFPNNCNLASAHSGLLTRSFYDGVLEIITDPEYRYSKVFPNSKLFSTNSKEETIDLVKKHRFSSLTCRAIGASLTGATRCEKILYADDLCSGIEEAMSKDRLDKLWDKYTNDLKSRKKLGCKEIHIATRWSVHDVIGRLEDMYGGDERCRFIVMPALDENGESNFNYDYGVGFDTKYFEDMRASLDDVSFRALFMNQPIEREGLLYNEDELRRYYELPGEPDIVLGVADTAEGGGDDTFLPVAYGYGDDWYIEDCVCTDALPEVSRPMCVDVLMRNNVKQCQFESNNAGAAFADAVHDTLKERGSHCNITKKRTTANKETKIIVNSAWVKEHCVFKDSSQYTRNSPYGQMIKKLCSYTIVGKNKHDDVPDGMAQLAEYIQGLAGKKIQVYKRVF